MQYSDTMGL